MPDTLYELDEVAWLDHQVELIEHGKHEEIDWDNLAEFLASMASRDKREVTSRLVTLMMHILKWKYQCDRRASGWLSTIYEQQRELEEDVKSGSLRRHAENILDAAYLKAVKYAAKETRLAPETFPFDCPWTVDDLLAYEPAT